MEVIDVKAAKEYVMGNYPNDPLLKHIAVSLLDQLPKVEMEQATSDETKQSVPADLQKVVTLLEQQYERACKLDYVYNPLAWALHQVWKKVDKQK